MDKANANGFDTFNFFASHSLASSEASHAGTRSGGSRFCLMHLVHTTHSPMSIIYD